MGYMIRVPELSDEIEILCTADVRKLTSQGIEVEILNGDGMCEDASGHYCIDDCDVLRCPIRVDSADD